MKPYAKTFRGSKIHDARTCGVCSEDTGISASFPRQLAKQEIEDELRSLTKENKMGCIYMDNDGLCTLSVDDEGVPLETLQLQGGAGEEGCCEVYDDPQPGDNCESYESDWFCNDCDVDLNIDDCQCEQEAA